MCYATIFTKYFDLHAEKKQIQQKTWILSLHVKLVTVLNDIYYSVENARA